MDDNDNNEISVKTSASGELTFLERSKLEATQKKLKKLSIKALNFMEEVLDDAEVDLKVKIDVAKFAATKYIDITDTIQKDGLVRLIKEVELKGLAVRKGLKQVGGETLDDNDDETGVYTNELIDVDKMYGDGDNNADNEVFDAGAVHFKQKEE